MEQASRKSFYINFVCTIAILGAFAIASLVLANVGVRVYKNIVAENANNYRLRTSLSYIATKIRQMDEQGCIYIENREGVELLVLEHKVEDQNYETLIYLYKGKLYEAMQEKDTTFSLKDGAYGYEITEVSEFKMAELSNNLMRFTVADDTGHEESIVLNIKSRR